MNSIETRIIDPITGGAKGKKLASPHLAPPDALLELFEHYGKGEIKYPSDEDGTPNYSRGYKWMLSYDAIWRHLNAWVSGENHDEETGSNHLICVAWHALGLVHFQNQGKGTDDRWFHRLEQDDRPK